MSLPSSAQIVELHDRQLEQRDRTEGSEYDPVWSAVRTNHGCNRLLWDEEDQARRRDVPDSAIAANKRSIDGLNQRRNDAIEKIDEALLAALPSPERNADVRLNSETAGAMIDRLSILALKIFHMRIQTERRDATDEHRATSRARLARLTEQRADLAGCFDALLADCLAGRARFKVYRQFKMYNDPAFNPYLYGTKDR
ncbi:MAG TPA: DUF4254 domain-containing protein [Burkholderiales bacterium]|nr:DUF4254 domain-containing protein [Burkholderiales bacterium]